MIAIALAKQGYLLAPKGAHPALFLVISWGYLAPIRRAGRLPPVNEMQMLTATLGEIESAGGKENYSFVQNLPNPRVQNAINAGQTARWILRVTAVDFDDWQIRHKVTPLWHAYITTALWGHYLDEVLPTMIADGVPMFGRETNGPQFIDDSIVPIGHVIVGTPVLKTDAPASVIPKPAP